MVCTIIGTILMTSAIGVTQHRVRLELAQEDATDLDLDDAVIIHDDISPAMLISSGIDLEGQQ
jgi:hypothetical protein